MTTGEVTPNRRADMRVFHGISGAAGQPGSIVAALRDLGIDAVSYISGKNQFGYAFDRQISTESDLHSALFQLLQSDLQGFDVFHFYFRPLFFDHRQAHYPMGLDLLLLRLLNKKLIMNFRGSEVRLHSQFKSRSPFNYVDENPDELVEKFPEASQRKLISLTSSLCHHVIVPDPELQSYVPNATVVPRSIDLRQWAPSPMAAKDRPLVVHAPSRRAVKGTDSILAAVEQLQQEGLNFDFKLVEGLTNAQARELYRDSDIIIDQLRIGWYGVLAVEGMALQKAVISYVRDDLAHHLGDQPPIAIANPESIKPVLMRLINSQDERSRLAERGRRYCEATHDAKIVAEQLIEIYASPGNAVRPGEAIQFFDVQHTQHLELQAQQAAASRELSRELAIAERKLELTQAHLDSVLTRLAPLIKLRNLSRKLIGR
ncbi:MAG: glycosyltransferase [Pseudomonadales bacterium]